MPLWQIDGLVLGESDESFGFGQKNLPQLQDHSAQRCRSCDLHRPPAQAASRLMGKVTEE
jgi:hypothetical protein